MTRSRSPRFLAAAALLPLALGACLADDLDAPLDENAPVAERSAALTTNPIDLGFHGTGTLKLPMTNVVARDVVVVGDKTWFVGTRVSVRNTSSPIFRFTTDAGIVVGRLTAAGELDPSFNGGELLSIPAPSSGLFPFMSATSGNAIVADGTGVIVGGSADSRFFLARVKADATLDTSFGSDHTGTISLAVVPGMTQSIADLAVDSRGRVVAFGTASDGGRSPKVALARFKRNGELDLDFNGGKVSFGYAAPTDYFVASRLAIAPHDFLVGAVTDSDGRHHLFRRTVDGRPDETFHLDSNAEVPPGTGKISAVVVRSTGFVYAAGSSSAGKLRVFRVSPGGYLDSDFGTNGVVDTDFVGDGESLAALAIDEVHKRLYAAGHSTGDFAISAYFLDGRRDSRFGNGGGVRTGFGNDAASISAMAWKDDRFVVAGQAISGDEYRAAFARYRIYAGQEGEPCYGDGSCDGNCICVPIGSPGDENAGGFCHM